MNDEENEFESRVDMVSKSVHIYFTIPKLIGIGIIIALIGAVFDTLVMYVYSPADLFANQGLHQSFPQSLYEVGTFIFYAGLGVVILCIFAYIVTRFIKPGD